MSYLCPNVLKYSLRVITKLPFILTALILTLITEPAYLTLHGNISR